MPAWILTLLRYLPGLGGIIGKLDGTADKVAEIRAETEQADIRGFHRTGRISAAHAWKYVKVFVALVVACSLCASLFFSTPVQNMSAIVDAIASVFHKLAAVEM